MPRYGYGGSERFRGPRQVLVFDPSKCGTRKGYRQHQNHGVEQCSDCKAAHARYMADYYRARGI
jgi:hypothetical protein